MADGNALGAVFTAKPDVSSYADPVGNALLARGWDGNAATQSALGTVQSVQQIQQNDIKISSDQIDLGRKRLGALNDVIGAIGADPTLDNAHARIFDAVHSGAWTPEEGQTALTELSQTDGSPAAIRQLALQHLAQNANIDQRLQMMGAGAPQYVNTGSKLQPVVPQSGINPGINPAGGGPLPITASPGEKMGGLNTKDPNTGATVFKGNSTLYDDQGNFIGNGSAPSIPVYRGGAGGGASAPPPLVGGNKAPPVSSQGGAANTPSVSTGQGQGAAPFQPPAPTPTATGTGGTPAASQGQGQGGSGLVAGAGGLVTPTPQTLPVITRDQAIAASNAMQLGKDTAVDRNVFRGYAVQNDMPLGKMGGFEAQPAGVGAAVPVPQGQGGGQGAPASPAPTSSAGSVPPGRQPPAPVQASGAGQGGAGPAFGQGATGGGVLTGLSPGQEASLKAGADTYSALSSDVTNPNGSNSRIFKIDRALDAIRNTTTGRGTAMRQEMLGTLDALPGGIGKLFPGVDPQSITNYDLATKYTNAIAQSSPGALRSDAGQSLAASANASTNGMTQQAATDVLTNQLGQERMNQAQLRAFNAAGLDPGQFPKWSAQWSRNVDPRAFALADMTPDERNAVWSGLKGPARNAFAASVSKAIAGGVYGRADIVNPGAAANGR